MSRAQRKQLFAIADLLEKANKILEKKLYAQNADVQAIISLVADCQDSAVCMGEQIEKDYGEGTQSVALLEEYCENLYFLTQELDDSSKKRERHHLLEKQLKRLRRIMSEELPDKLEVAFFPYKASMWDSLESVFLKQKANSDCEVYCVPIPYFDRNADGSLGQMHYEGNQYPPNIEITDWQSYSFEERRPDVIYIHNPYDKWNLVTCVHPRFFSDNLKKYTDKLVYIPYFVLEEIEPEDQRSIDSMKHFVWTPGVIYADQVILQSEKMKRIYVNEFIKAAKENGLSGDFINRRRLEEKFQGTGSPKFEKIVNAQKDGMEIPPQWRRIIQKPDGSRKKIVLYNIGITALLQHGDHMIDKIQNVLRVFYEKRDMIALLWRPHPLIKNTISSMRPQLYAEYEKIVSQYRAEGWGIYDDTPDMDRAVILSDAYYGDESSVVQLYQKTNQPVMIQNVNGGNEAQYFEICCSCSDQHIQYFVPFNYSVLVVYDQEEGKVKKLIPLQCRRNINGLYSDIICVEKRLCLVPQHAQKIAIYDTDTEEITYLVIPEYDTLLVKWGFFSKGYRWNQYVYLVGYTYPGIVRINMETLEIRRVFNVYEWMNASPRRDVIGLGTAKIGACLFIYVKGADSIIEFNMDLLSVERHMVGIGEAGQDLALAECDGKLWITNNGIDYVKWDLETDKKESISRNIRLEEKRCTYQFGIRSQKTMYFLSCQGGRVVSINSDEPLYGEIVRNESNGTNIYKPWNVWRESEEGEKAFFFDLDSRKTMQIDGRGKLDDYLISQDRLKIAGSLLQIKGIILDERDLSVNEYLDCIAERV